jgi:hypothetical protein
MSFGTKKEGKRVLCAQESKTSAKGQAQAGPARFYEWCLRYVDLGEGLCDKVFWLLTYLDIMIKAWLWQISRDHALGLLEHDKCRRHGHVA